MNNITKNKSYQISLPQTIRFGEGVTSTLSDELGKMGVKKAIIITDPGIAKSGLVQPVREQAAKAAETDVFSEAEPEPSFDKLNETAQALRAKQYDAIIGLGGGSSIDTAKALSILLAYGGTGQDYAGTDKVPGPGIPLIAMPTTAGTGSEVTNVAVFSDTQKELKIGIVSTHLLPKLALVDPELTYGCPAGVTAASGIDAMVHAIECYTSPKANSFTDAMAMQALELISGSLAAAVNNGQDKAARRDMAEGANLAGIAFGNSSVAAVHALAYPLGARFHVSHGVANGLLLPYVMKYNLPAASERYAYIAGILDKKAQGLPTIRAAENGISAIQKLIQAIGIPSRLRDLKVPKDALEGLAVATMDVSRLLVNNPRELTLDDVRGIWQDAW